MGTEGENFEISTMSNVMHFKGHFLLLTSFLHNRIMKMDNQQKRFRIIIHFKYHLDRKGLTN